MYSRIDVRALGPGTLVFLDKVWASRPQGEASEGYGQAIRAIRVFHRPGYEVVGVPIEEECLKTTQTARRGKNMWEPGFLTSFHMLDVEVARKEVARTFKHKNQSVIEKDLSLLDSGYQWARPQLRKEQLSLPVKQSEWDPE